MVYLHEEPTNVHLLSMIYIPLHDKRLNVICFVPFSSAGTALLCLYNISGIIVLIKSEPRGPHFHSVPCGQGSHYIKALKLMR